MEENSRIVITGVEYQSFRDDVFKRIRSAQYEAMRAVNKEMISLYWEIGRQITERQKTLGWGKSVVENLSHDIQAEFPGIQGFSVRNIRNMTRFYTEYQSNEFLQPLVAELVGLSICTAYPLAELSESSFLDPTCSVASKGKYSHLLKKISSK